MSDVNEEPEQGNSSKSNSVNSEHSLQSHGISASSQGSSTNSLPVGMAPPNDHHHHHHYSNIGAMGAPPAAAAAAAAAAALDHHHHHAAAAAAAMGPGQAAMGFHRPQATLQQQSQAAKSKLSQVNPRKILAAAPGLGGVVAGNGGDDDGIDPKNFATIRTTSIVQRQQKEHLQEEMHDQMSGYKRMRRDHQAALARLEENCRQEMEKHKNQLDREYEQLLTQFSKDLERLQLKHQEELGKTVRRHF